MTHIRLTAVCLAMPLLVSCSRVSVAHLETVPKAPMPGETLVVVPAGIDVSSDANLVWTVHHNGTPLTAAGYETREHWLRVDSAESGSYSFTLALSEGNSSTQYTNTVVVADVAGAEQAARPGSPAEELTYTTLAYFQSQGNAADTEDSSADTQELSVAVIITNYTAWRRLSKCLLAMS